MSHQEFLNKIGNVPVLTAAEEIMLARRIARGGKAGARAREKMMVHNLKLVATIANTFMRSRRPKLMAVDDLFQAGVFGLNRAIEKWDPERGYKFSTYAFWWIRQSISRDIDKYDSCMHITTKPRKMLVQVFKSLKRLHNIDAAVKETAELMKVDRNDVVDALTVFVGTRSLSDILGDDLELSDALTTGDDPRQGLEYNDNLDQVRQTIAQLPPDEAAAIAATYGVGTAEITIKEHARRLGVSHWQAQTTVQRGRERLRGLLSQAKLFSTSTCHP